MKEANHYLVLPGVPLQCRYYAVYWVVYLVLLGVIAALVWLVFLRTSIGMTTMIVTGYILLIVSSFIAHTGVVSAELAAFKPLIQENQQLRSDLDASRNTEALWRQSLRERANGFQSLAASIEKYEELRDASLADGLRYKRPPARKASELVQEESKRRRLAETAQRRAEAIVDYYETIAPFLLELKGDVLSADDANRYEDYSETELDDPVTGYVAKEEYRSLSPAERNQRALDRFWQRPMSNWLLGRIYERYIGYLFEKERYDVDYVGIWKGYDDLGRDLVCRKDGHTVIVQCKNWASYKTVHEKHIFQLFGTTFQHKEELLATAGAAQRPCVSAVFCTTTKVSLVAQKMAHQLGIKICDERKLDRGYPCIKCNIGPRGERIYHLPFDQQYDRTKICKPGEFYAQTVAKAEEAGFRRAFRHFVQA